MSEKRFLLQLSEAERQHLMGVIRSARISVRKRTAAQVLLMVDQSEYGPSWTEAEAAEAYHCHPNYVTQLRRRLVARGFETVLDRKPQIRPSRARKLDAAGEKELIAIAQSAPPDGRVRWTYGLVQE